MQDMSNGKTCRRLILMVMVVRALRVVMMARVVWAMKVVRAVRVARGG